MIPHNLPTLGIEEQSAASAVIGSRWVAQGYEVESFEEQICRFFDLPPGHAVAVTSGSAALFLALWALDSAGKRVGLPVYSCSALRNAIAFAGGESIYLDCEANGPNVDTVAAGLAGLDVLIAPSMFGIPVILPESSSYAVIEDLAQALGASVRSERIGLRGAIGICSFFATKLMTTGGQGGALISANKTLIDKVRDFREFDCRNDAKLRFNFQMTDLQAAVGRVQLRRLPEFIKRRERWFQIYQKEGLDLLGEGTFDLNPVRYRIVMRSAQPASVIAELSSAGIRAIVPIKESELLSDPARFPMASILAKTTVSLPAYPGLQEEDVVRIARVAKQAA